MSEVTRLPFVAKASTVTGQADPVMQLFDLMVQDPGQQRKGIHWDPAIAAVAQARCAAMLERGSIFINHLDDARRGPNKWLRDAGVALPDYYSHYPGQQGPNDHENNVESIGLNYLTAALCWAGWLSSPDHRTHVLGEGMFDTQTQVGIGFSIGPKPYPIFWSAITCPPPETV